MDPEIPQELADAMATEPAWLKAWIIILVLSNVAAVLFVLGKEAERWRIRFEPVAILAAFFAAALLMESLYQSFGYVRLLGIAHVVFWGPVWFWVLTRHRQYAPRTAFGAYLRIYLVIAGISLFIDVVDVARYLLGDGELWGRWAVN